MLAEVDRLRRDNEGRTSVDYATLTGQLEEAGEQQTRLKETLCENESRRRWWGLRAAWTKWWPGPDSKRPS